MNDECFTKPKNSPPRAGKKGLQKVMKLLLAHTNNFHMDLGASDPCKKKHGYLMILLIYISSVQIDYFVNHAL